MRPSLRSRAGSPSVKNDIERGFFDMIKVTVVEIEGCLASSAAITHDVMATANQISKTAKRPLAFNVTTLRYGRRNNRDRLRAADLVIVPGLGLGVATADELEAKLSTAACRRAADMLAQ